jgi:hypothetical protein
LFGSFAFDRGQTDPLSTHSPLYRAAAPIIDGAVRKAIQTTVETQVKDWVGYLNDQVTNLKSSGAQAAKEAGQQSDLQKAKDTGLNKFLVSLDGMETEFGRC